MTEPSRHSAIEDAQGIAFGVCMAAVGMHILTYMGFIAGQTTGVAALISYAQVPLRNPRPASAASTTPSASRPPDYPLAPAPRYATAGHPGTYRLPDGSWHPAEIFGPDLPDRVRLRPENLTSYAVFLPNEVPAYVVWGDTFVIVPAFVRRKRHQLVPASYAQRLYRDPGYEVLLFQGPTPETLCSSMPSRRARQAHSGRTAKA